MKSTELEITKGFAVVEAGIDEPIIADDKAAEILAKEAGIVTLSRDTVKNLTKLGLYARGVGVLRKQRGEVMVSQVWLNESIKPLVDLFNKECSKAEGHRSQNAIRIYGALIADLIRAKNESQELAITLEKVAAPTGKPDDIEPPRNTAFGPGPVIIAQSAVINEPKKDLQEGKPGP